MEKCTVITEWMIQYYEDVLSPQNAPKGQGDSNEDPNKERERDWGKLENLNLAPKYIERSEDKNDKTLSGRMRRICWAGENYYKPQWLR